MSTATVSLNLNETARTLLNPEVTRSDSKGIAKALYSQACIDTLGAFVTPEQAGKLTQKQRLTVARVVEFIVSGSTSGYMRESAILGAMLALMPEDTRIAFADAQVTMGLQGDQFTRPVPGVSRQRMMRFFGSKPAAGTVLTRLSQMRGMWDVMGVTEKGDAHGFSVKKGGKGNALLTAYAVALEQMTDGALALLTKDKGE